MEETKLRVVEYPADTIYPYSVFREGIGGKTTAKYYGDFETRKEAEAHIRKLEGEQKAPQTSKVVA